MCEITIPLCELECAVHACNSNPSESVVSHYSIRRSTGTQGANKQSRNIKHLQYTETVFLLQMDERFIKSGLSNTRIHFVEVHSATQCKEVHFNAVKISVLNKAGV